MTAQEELNEKAKALEAARIQRLPGEAFYIPDFVSREEEERLLAKISSAPLPTWKHLSHRRLQTYPNALTATNTLLAAPLPSWLTSSPPILERFAALSLFDDAPHKGPNHVLVNEYTPGQGIMPHEDGAAYYPLVATVSLGGVVVLDLYEKNQDQGHSPADDDDGDGEEQGRGRTRQPKFRILQERRSLLVTRGGIYRDYLHGIAEREREEKLGPESICNWELLGDAERFAEGECERGTRVSLTYRDVLKVAKLGSTMKFLNRH
ncbi:uncharacterized protein DSM5745_00899 [Aspergillus mulundensis]|uniref:Fe2OG dioxygenase domain-containing protein n=1 Tax=Aspergillus mulundensis TaxID=1810919 RepID=A0A3D8T4T3_9EURO|nr:Uncharacterized protein DSM5745_00899 [Aspergillus mulundensis]RDW93577.1 Uncharacterized protein DSM5745_00899 [Aspergillus mulundensis]